MALLYEPDAPTGPAVRYGDRWQFHEPPSVGFARAPPALRSRLGARGAGRFRLRRGDFIEDRFGTYLALKGLGFGLGQGQG